MGKTGNPLKIKHLRSYAAGARGAVSLAQDL